MHSDDVPVVRAISLFSSMTEEHFENLLQMAYLQRFPEHVRLTTEGEPADFLHVLVEGSVELFTQSNDREVTMFVVRPVSAFNLSAVLNDSVFLMSARTLDMARVLIIPSENVRRVMHLDSEFAHSMVMELSKRYRNTIRAFKEQRLRTSVERLANYLIRAENRSSEKGTFELTEDKRKIAALLGMTPENLSRAFKTLREYGVEVKGGKINLTNMRKLKGLAQPNPLIDNRDV